MITLDPRHVPVRPGELALIPALRMVLARPRFEDGAMMWVHGPRDLSLSPLVRRLDANPRRLPQTIWLYDGALVGADPRLFCGEQVQRMDLDSPRIGWHESGRLILRFGVWRATYQAHRLVRVIGDVEEIMASVPAEHFEAALEALTGVPRVLPARVA